MNDELHVAMERVRAAIQYALKYKQASCICRPIDLQWLLRWIDQQQILAEQQAEERAKPLTTQIVSEQGLESVLDVYELDDGTWEAFVNQTVQLRTCGQLDDLLAALTGTP